MFCWDFEVDAWSRFCRWYLIKTCVWNCDMNSTLGSVVPLAMFIFQIKLSFLAMPSSAFVEPSISVRLSCSTPIFPGFIDELQYCRQVSGTPQTTYFQKALDVSYPKSDKSSNTETNTKKDTNKGNSWKTGFFFSSASSSKTKRDIGVGPTGEIIVMYGATNALSIKSGSRAVLTKFCLPEVGRCW